jgi:single-strand DNA-binding protein
LAHKTGGEIVNVVTLIGNLATDVELREVGGDRKVAGFLLAVDRPGRESEADFVWVSAWDRQGELCSEHLGKGKQVAVDGRLRSRTWEEDGKRRRAVEVVAKRVEFLSSRSAAEAPFETADASR